MSQRKRRNRKAAAAHDAPGTMIHPDAASIDVGAEELAAVLPGRCEGAARAHFQRWRED